MAAFSGKWDFKVIPVSFGYQYLFSDPGNKLKPFAGLSISYSFIKIEYNSSVSEYDKIFNVNRFGIEPNFGFLYDLSEIFSFITEIRYRYLEDINLNLYQDVNLSGLSGSMGVQVKVL